MVTRSFTKYWNETNIELVTSERFNKIAVKSIHIWYMITRSQREDWSQSLAILYSSILGATN